MANIQRKKLSFFFPYFNKLRIGKFLHTVPRLTEDCKSRVNEQVVALVGMVCVV